MISHMTEAGLSGYYSAGTRELGTMEWIFIGVVGLS